MVLSVDINERIATITLDRPESRNALNGELRSALRQALTDAEANSEVGVMILTGADPAFCAGLDLKELGSGGSPMNAAAEPDKPADMGMIGRPFPARTKPLIGAINGAAITGGFELALNCDFLIASERAVFADTHARVGVMPGWGLTVLLASAIGVRRARELSLTGRFLTAEDAHRLGLVNHVVAHSDLLTTVREIAADIVATPSEGATQMLATYQEIVDQVETPGWATEAANGAAFRQREGFDPATVEARRAGIVARGRGQLG